MRIFSLLISVLILQTHPAWGDDIQPSVDIDGAWVRAMPPSQRTTAAYFVMSNTGETALEVTGVSMDLAGQAEFHTSEEVDGYLSMRHLDRVPLQAGQSVKLTPGGIHLMLMGLDAMPASGSVVNLCIEFASGAPMCFDAPVQKRASSRSSKHQNHH